MSKTAILILVALLLTTPLRAQEIRHRFLAKDESRTQLHYVDQTNPARDWTLKLPGKHRDLQLVGNNRVMLSSPDGFSEYSLIDQSLLREVHGYPGAQSARRLIDGRTLLACANKGVIVHELDASDKPLRKASFTPAQLRMMRQSPQGTLYFGHTNHIYEVDLAGTVHRDIELPKGAWVYQALRLPNGNILASGGYIPAIFEIDPQGKIVRTLGGKDHSLAKELGFYFFGCMQLLKNGDLVVCNWTGHGASDSTKGTQILQFNPAGQVVWKWHDPNRAGSIHGVIVLDELDTTVLNDDTSSVLQAVR